MGKTRKLWERLRGDRDQAAQVSDDVTVDSGSSTHEISAVGTTEPDLTARQDKRETAEDIWLAAYKKLQEDEETRKMVEAYETLLSNQLDGESSAFIFSATAESQT